MRTTIVFVTLVALLALVVGAGFYLHYFDLRTTTTPDNSRTEVHLGIDKQKVKNDVQAIEDRAEKLKENLEKKAGELKQDTKTLVFGPSVKGVIVSVDPTKQTLTIENDEKPEQVVFHIVADTKIHVDGKDATLTQLNAGDIVTVVHSDEQGSVVARSVTVRRG